MQFEQWKNRTILCAGLGEVLFDVFPNGMKLGGAPANFAYHCSQMGFSSFLVSAVGNDAYGKKIEELLSHKQMRTYLPHVGYPTGRVQIKVDADGIPNYTFLADTAYDHIPLTDALLETAKKTNVACFGTLAQRSEESRKTILAFLRTMPKESIRLFDVNLRGNFYTKEVIETSLKHCEIVKCNDEELPLLAQLIGLPSTDPESFAAYLKKVYGIDCVIYTEGAIQSRIFLNGTWSILPTPPTQVVDTVGAGDSFGAACLCALLSGYSHKTAHTFASQVASFVCGQEGAMPPFLNHFKLKA